MISPTLRLLARLSPAAQVLRLRQLPAEELLALHRSAGLGAAECDCPVEFAPCPQHTLSRFALVCRAVQVDEARAAQLSERQRAQKPALTIGRAAELSDGKLFAKAFPEFNGADHCDCPAYCEPCEHTADRSWTSPLSPEAKVELLRLLAALGCVERVDDYPDPVFRSRCATRETKAGAMARRHAAGYGLYHPQDRLQRDIEIPTFMTREVKTRRNGSVYHGQVALRVTA